MGGSGGRDWIALDHLEKMRRSTICKVRSLICFQAVVIPMLVFFTIVYPFGMIHYLHLHQYTMFFFVYGLVFFNASLITACIYGIVIWTKYLNGEWNWVASELKIREKIESIAAIEPSITCRKCGMTSYHPDDIRYKWCGKCHTWNTSEEVTMSE